MDVAPGDGFTPVGRIAPRHARDIRSSNWSVGAETMDRDFTIYKNWREYLGPLGVKAARIQSGWAKTEKAPGVYDWAWLDEILLDMVDQGVAPWVCLCYGNPIYPDGGGTGLGGGIPTSNEALEAWDRFVAAMVDRYKEHVDQWEVWNEPGLRGANSAEIYGKFLVRTAETIREHQPEGRVIGFAMAGIKHAWVDSVLKYLDEEDKLALIDEISYHPYSYNPDASYGGVEALRALVQSYSKKITLRQGENGAPSQRGSFGALAAHDWTESSQAKWALRRLLGDLGHDIPSSYFAICDMEYTSRRNYKGLLAINDDKTVHHAKPAYRAVQHLTAIFDDQVHRVHDFDAAVTGAKDSTYSVFGYRSNNAKPLVTIWRSSDTPGVRPAIERISLMLKKTPFVEPVWVDLRTGRVFAIAESLWQSGAETTTFNSLPVYDSPVVIAQRSAIDGHFLPPGSGSID